MYERLIMKNLDCITYITSETTSSLSSIKETYHQLCRYLLTNNSVVIYKGFIVSEIKRAYYTENKNIDLYKKYIKKIVYYRNSVDYKLPSFNTLTKPDSMKPLLRYMSQWVYNKDWFERFYGNKVNAEMSPVVSYAFNYLKTSLHSEDISEKFFASLPFNFSKCFYMFLDYHKFYVEKSKGKMGLKNNLLVSNCF